MAPLDKPLTNFKIVTSKNNKKARKQHKNS